MKVLINIDRSPRPEPPWMWEIHRLRAPLFPYQIVSEFLTFVRPIGP